MIDLSGEVVIWRDLKYMMQIRGNRIWAGNKEKAPIKQDYFCTDIKDINSPKYEDNAINALLEMKKVKTEIEQLEYYIQLK